MADQKALFEINQALDAKALAKDFAECGRLQIRNFLTEETADTIHNILSKETPWGISWEGEGHEPAQIRERDMQALGQDQLREMSASIEQAMRGDGYAFSYRSYPLVQAYLEKWDPGSPHDLLLEYLNAPEFLDFMRVVTGIPEIVKADGQATFFGPGQFLAIHTDQIAAQHRRVAYVLNFCKRDWRPDWGGYLNFYNDDGDVIDGFKPRFNAINFFRVPQMHNVTMVAPFAPPERFAITGWLRDG